MCLGCSVGVPPALGCGATSCSCLCGWHGLPCVLCVCLARPCGRVQLLSHPRSENLPPACVCRFCAQKGGHVEVVQPRSAVDPRQVTFMLDMRHALITRRSAYSLGVSWSVLSNRVPMSSLCFQAAPTEDYPKQVTKTTPTRIQTYTQIDPHIRTHSVTPLSYRRHTDAS